MGGHPSGSGRSDRRVFGVARAVELRHAPVAVVPPRDEDTSALVDAVASDT